MEVEECSRSSPKPGNVASVPGFPTLRGYKRACRYQYYVSTIF
jgi:hypothetical protein